MYNINFVSSKLHKNEISFYLDFVTHEIALMKFIFLLLLVFMALDDRKYVVLLCFKLIS